MSWSLQLILGTCVLVLSVINCIPSYPILKWIRVWSLYSWVEFICIITWGIFSSVSMMSLFDFFKLFFDLRNPYEVRLYSLRVLYLHILQLVSQSHLSVDVLSFEHLCQRIIYFLRCLACMNMGDEVILNRICKDSLSLFHAYLMSIISLISLWLCNFSSDILIQNIIFKYQGDFVLSFLEFISPSKLVLKMSMASHLFKWEPQMEITNI